MDKEPESLEEINQQLESISNDISRSVSRRLFMWAVRWCIGFGLVAWITHYNEGYQWLWYVAIGIATLSLTITLLLHRMMMKNVRAVNDLIEDE